MNEYDIAAAYIKERIAVSLGDFRPELAIILGSGLGGLCLAEAGVELFLRRGGAGWRDAIQKGDKSKHGQ